MKKTLSLLLSLVLMLSLALPASAAETEYPTLEGGVTEIQKYGNIVLDIDPADLKDGGYTYGDLLTVTVNGTGYDMPLCTNYSDVDTGALVLRDSEGVLIAAINMGDFATSNGLAAKVTAEDGSYTWEFPEGQSLESITVSISMKEQGGYYDQYLIHQLTRTDERADYASDAVFANFRNVAVGDLGENAFFRSSSPVNNELGRASYADDLAEAGGIQAVMNLADSNELIEGYIAAEGFDSPYYQSLYEAGKVKALNLGVDFTAADFKSGLAEGLRFFAENEGPYLVHCTEGKDRAGFVSALLECLMGATYDEVVADYMTTYVNYYHLEEGSEQYEAVKNSNIVSILTNITGAAEGTDLTTVDLAAAAEDYMLDAGLTADEVTALKANLAKDYTVETEAPAEETPEEPVPQAQTYTVEAGDCLWNIAYAPPASTRVASAHWRIREPSRRSSSFKRPTAFSSWSLRRELEQHSSAKYSVSWAGVFFSGFISRRVTSIPRWASCQAASEPARPAPITVTFIVWILYLSLVDGASHGTGNLAPARGPFPRGMRPPFSFCS